jgi:hypothetical protein
MDDQKNQEHAKKSISWGTKVISTYNPNVKPSLSPVVNPILGLGRNSLIKNSPWVKKSQSVLKQGENAAPPKSILRTSNQFEKINKLKRLSQIAIIKQYEEPIIV